MLAGMKKRATPLPGGHPIRVVSLRTGLSPDVLRVWEKRYQAVTPGRTPTGRRTYTDQDLERLRLLHQATLGGRRIGDVAGLPDAALRQLVERDREERAAAHSPPSPSPDAYPPDQAGLEDGLEAVRALDAPRLEAILRRGLLSLGVTGFIETLAAPLVRRIGRLWEDGSLDPYEEHFATVIVRRVLEESLREVAEDDARPTLLVATPARQRHEIGALLAAAYATAQGWRAVYLGPDLPAADIARAARARRVRAVALSIVYPGDDPQLVPELGSLRGLLPKPVALILGGAGAAAYLRESDIPGAVLAPELRDLGAVLVDLDRKTSPRPVS